MCITSTLFAQEPDASISAQDTVKVEPIQYKKNGKPRGSGFMISGLRIGIDLLPPITQAIDNKFQGIGIYSDLMIRNEFFLTFEYGQESRLRDENLLDYTYKSEGSFYTIGLDYNLIKNKTIHDAIYIGLKYTMSNFDQHAEYFVAGSDYWEEGGTRKEFTETGLKASWLELSVGVKFRIWKGLYIDGGTNLLMPTKFPKANISITDLPGYGFVKEAMGKLNYHYRIAYKIPLGKIYVDPVLPKK